MQVLKILAKRIAWLTLFVNTQKHEILGTYVLANLKEISDNVIIIGISRERRVYSEVLPEHASCYLHNPTDLAVDAIFLPPPKQNLLTRALCRAILICKNLHKEIMFAIHSYQPQP